MRSENVCAVNEDRAGLQLFPALCLTVSPVARGPSQNLCFLICPNRVAGCRCPPCMSGEQAGKAATLAGAQSGASRSGKRSRLQRAVPCAAHALSSLFQEQGRHQHLRSELCRTRVYFNLNLCIYIRKFSVSLFFFGNSHRPVLEIYHPLLQKKYNFL